MKTNATMVLLTVCGALAFFSGCGQNDSAAPPTAKDTQLPAAASQTQMAAEAQRKAEAERTALAAQATEAAKMAETAKAEVLKKQADAEKQAADALAKTAAAAQENSRILGLIDSAKALSGQSKYAEALKILTELSNLKLTPEQQALVGELKQAAEKQIAKAVADKAAAGASKAVGNALGGKP